MQVLTMIPFPRPPPPRPPPSPPIPFRLPLLPTLPPTQLHPAVHARILEVFFERHATNLWIDTSWDVLAKHNFVNYDGRPIESIWSSWASEDLTDDALFDMPKWTSARERLDKIWQAKKHLISKTVTTLTGPSHKMAVLLDLMERYPDR